MMRRVVFTVILAFVLWTIMFSPWTAPHVNFWWAMTGSACLLTLLSSLFAPGWWKRISLTPSNIIYGMKEGESPWLLTALLLLLIGPAEEIFWRGYVQEAISKRWNANIGFVVTTLVYALVHAGSFNFMLLMAALVAGMAWGLLYRFFPERFTAIIISHAIWDAAVFIWFPIM